MIARDDAHRAREERNRALGVASGEWYARRRCYYRGNATPITDGSVSFGELENPGAHPGRYWMPGVFLSGDYCGNGALGVANRRAFVTEFGERDSEGCESLPPWAVWVSGDFGAESIAIHDHAPDEAWEWFRALENYPVADDETLWEVEQERQAEAWESCGRDDLAREIGKGWDLDDVPDDALEAFLDAAMHAEDSKGRGLWIDEPQRAWCRVEDIAEGIDPEAIRALPGAKEKPTMDPDDALEALTESIRELAVAYTEPRRTELQGIALEAARQIGLAAAIGDIPTGRLLPGVEA